MTTKILALFAMGALALAGCDGDDDDNSNSDTAVTTIGGSSPGTAGDDGSTGGGGSGDTAGASDDSMADTAAATTMPADDDDDSGGLPGCEPACAANESCVAGSCIPNAGEESGGGGEGDPNYPNPAGGCPAGTVDGNTAIMANICIPQCDGTAANIQLACPQAATGTAAGLCVLGNGMGSNDACEMNGAACPGDSEFCLQNAMMMNVCSNATGCLLSCQQGVCPDGMSCNADSLCEY